MSARYIERGGTGGAGAGGGEREKGSGRRGAGGGEREEREEGSGRRGAGGGEREEGSGSAANIEKEREEAAKNTVIIKDSNWQS